MNRTGPLSGRLLFYSALLLAATMLALMLVPAKFWKQAEDGGTYEGFDPNLVYTQPKSSGALNEGEIKVTDSQLNLIALPASEPFAHLLTTPMSFDASMNLVVGENSEDSDPLRIGIWSVRNGSGYYLNFGPAPRNLVTAQLVKEKEIISEETLGTYSPDQIYQLQLSLDREKQEIKTQISGEPLPIPGNAIKLDGGPKDASYSDVFSDFFPVIPGQRYKYGGWLRPVVGSDTYKISLFWYDTQKEFISFSNSWLPVKHIKDWTRIELEAEAPPTAASARLFIGSGNGTSLLFAGLFAHRADSPNDLLINNGNFLNGLSGWNWHAGREGPASVSPSSLNASTVVTADQAPDIFESVRLSLTASASSSQEVSSATIDNYNLTLSPELPHVLVTKNGKLPVLVLAVAGILLGLWRSSLWLAERRARKPGSQLGAREGSQVMRVARPLLLGIGAAAAVYFIGNAALFGLGAHPFDVTSEKVWAYVGAKYNIFELYPLSSTVSLAKVWNGSPYHEAVFPYLATMAYYSTGIGWLYRIFLGGPGPLSMDGFGLEFLIKSGNVIFGFADAVLIVLILRRLGLKLNLALQSSALLLFNPALWINMSIWGETETI
ncbi:MAG TPA: hypothetical protein VNL15_05570, partial [Dehalococcoidia bacterium]|nr:hypothetical protein [Dehalococcoidia bacterium]